MRETFIPKEFRGARQDLIDKANKILSEYATRGFRLTVRQLYYQFVARAYIPNHVQEYKRLAATISDARLAGLVDWSMIEDRTRNLRYNINFQSPSHAIRSISSWYQEDLWRLQKHRPEVWIEKDALVGVISDICSRERVPYFACRGYASQSELYDAGKRMAKYIRQGFQPIVFHFGDHDPSGIDMTRDNEERLNMFAGGEVVVKRLALNMNQIDQYDPPPNPAKMTDVRFAGYEARFGDESWELDALEPEVIAQLIQDGIDGIREPVAWDNALEMEQEHREQLNMVSSRWDEIIPYLQGEI
jgi:hypothetical protein